MIRNSPNDNHNNNHEQNFISDDDNSIDLEESTNNMDDSTSTNNMMVVSSLDENSLHDAMNDDSSNNTNSHSLVEHSSTIINSSNSPTTMMMTSTLNTTTTPNITKPFRSLPPLDTRNLQPNLEFNRSVRQSSDNLSNRRRIRLLSYEGLRATDGNSGDIAQQTISNNDDVVVEEETTTSSNNNTEAINDNGIVNATPTHHVYQEDIYTNMPTNNSSPSSLMITNQDSPTSVSTELMEDSSGSSPEVPQNVDPMNPSGQFSSLLTSTPTRSIEAPSVSPYLFPSPENQFPILSRINQQIPNLSVRTELFYPSETTSFEHASTTQSPQENNDLNVNLDDQVLLSPKSEEKELVDLSKHDISPPTTITTENNEIPHNFICPITKLIMYSPVRNMYGKVYERESIDQWWKTLSSKQQQPTDPLTNQIVSDKTLIEDIDLKNQIQSFLNRNSHLRFSINDLYFPKQIIREMKVAIDGESYAKIVHLLSQFPANFFVQTKFPVPPQSAQGKSKNEKETSVSVFDCLYRRFKTVFDSVRDGSPSDVHFMNDPIIGFVVRQYLIVRNYFVERQKHSTSKVELSEFKMAENSISEGLKNIFVNSVRLFPNVAILNWFVSIGASISSTNQFKQNAFHMACMTDQVEIAKHLFHLNNISMSQNPSCVNIVEERLSDEVKRKWNAFYLAIWHNSQKIIDWVVDDHHLASRFLGRKHKCMVKDKSSIYHPMNALSLAAYKKNIPLMEVLIKKFSFEVPDEKYHPIYWSCIANDLNGFKWICNFIEANIPNGAEVLKSQLKAINERAFKRSLIHAIAMEASDDMMEFYLQKCKDLDILDYVINTQDSFGNTALHYACEKSKTKTLSILVKEGIAHEYVNRQGKIASQCCKTDDDREAIQKAIKAERELLKSVVHRVKELEDDVSFLKRKILEIEEFNKRRKFE